MFQTLPLMSNYSYSKKISSIQKRIYLMQIKKFLYRSNRIIKKTLETFLGWIIYFLFLLMDFFGLNESKEKNNLDIAYIVLWMWASWMRKKDICLWFKIGPWHAQRAMKMHKTGMLEALSLVNEHQKFLLNKKKENEKY